MLALELNGVLLHARVDGPVDGPTIVFSNSLGTDFRIWDDMLPLIPAELRVLRYDKRGHGLSDCPADAWGMDAHIDDLSALLGHFNVKKPVVVGLSVGGMIAQGLAARGVDLAGLVLMDTAAKIGTPELWSERIAAIQTGGIESLAEPILERWFAADYRANAPELGLYRNMLVRTTQHGYMRTCAAIRDADFTASTADLRLPALAIAGDEDGSTPPDLVRATADLIPDARFEIVERAAHLPNVERPERTAELLNAFLKEIGFV